MINYYRDIVPNKTSLYKPLHRFTSSKIPFTWLPSDKVAYKAIQQAFAEAVLVAFPDFDKPFEVYSDASGTQIGGMIMQGTNSLLATQNPSSSIKSTKRSQSSHCSLSWSSSVSIEPCYLVFSSSFIQITRT